MKGSVQSGLALGLVSLLAVCAGCGPPAQRPASAPAAPRVLANQSPSLKAAMQHARDRGELAPGRVLDFALTLVGRDPSGLQQLIDRGGRVTPAEFASRYGPASQAVDALRGALSAHGITLNTPPGDTVVTAHGSVAAVENVFQVRIHDFRESSGREFYAPLHAPAIPAWMRSVVVAVTGLDDYSRASMAALPPSDKNGVTPSDAASFYDATGLIKAGLDGTGQTIVFLEFATPADAILQAYAQKFTPQDPIHVDFRTNDAWGHPFQASDQPFAQAAGEAALDIEVAHGIAPKARLVVYSGGADNPSGLALMVQAVANDFPHAILSSSISFGFCEHLQEAEPLIRAVDAAAAKAAAQGMSIFWATGDHGAYECLYGYPDPISDGTQVKSPWPDSDSPNVTAVGGTIIFIGQGGTYFQEGAWGEPAEQWGGGGGVSTLFQRPSYQTGPEVPSNLTGRGIPDVSADGDAITGWDVFQPSQDDPSQPVEEPVGGTSAATPFWAGFTALIDQDLVQKHLPTVGFANPALYTFAQSPQGLPAPAFHDITLGTNLGYDAGPGWDAATGLGTPDIAALADDFEWYERNHSGSS